jgi:two-component system cell cycle sensor histidine kinase/response regulator CckA
MPFPIDSSKPPPEPNRRGQFRRQEDRLLLHHERQLDAARRISQALFQHTNIDEVVRKTLCTALEVIGADAGSVLLADYETKQLVFRYVIGEKADILHGLTMPWEKGIAGAVFTSGQSEVLPDVKLDPRHFPEFDLLTGYKSRDMIVLPLRRWGGEPIGVLEVLNKREGQLNQDDIDILIVVSALSAAAIEQIRAVESLQQKEQQLRQAQKMEAIGRLAGGIAHDFNNLLTGVRGYSELLFNHFLPGDPLRNYLDAIRQAADQAASLTHQLLAFSRRQVLAPRVLDLNAVVTNLGPMLRRLIGEDIELSILLHRGLGRVRADQSQIEQIMLNLMVNARDAMPTGGKLTIELANIELDKPYAIKHDLVPPGRYVRLVVSDNGCGMDAETQAHIFEPFFTTKEPWKGSGLGLSTVYGIVKQSGGHICLHSEPDRGTTFTIYLPHTLDVLDVPQTVQTESTGVTSLGGVETVLVVDDNETVVGVVRNILERNGYTALVARTSGEVFRISGQHEGIIHLMIADVVMPGMNGRELAERLRSARPNMKVLYMSGYLKDAYGGHGGVVEDVPFLQKPFTPDALLKKVREALGIMR